MNVGSLFSGIGGLDHGLARAGFEHAFLCESDEWRRTILRERFPGVPIYEDVREVASGSGRRRPGSVVGNGARPDIELDGSPLPVKPAFPDLLCGGFPCQDVSVAGRRAGLAGARSGLFHEFARIADAFQPRWLLVENVPGLLSSNGGRDFGVVLGTLADLGYGVAWRVLDSRFFGVPQRRRRVFIVGAKSFGDPRAAAGRAGEILAVGQGCPRHSKTRGEAGPDAAVASLSGLGSGGPDDNDGQGGRPVSLCLSGKAGKRDDGESETFIPIAAPLSHGSNPNSNMAGRRREDDFNLVAGPLGGGNDGTERRTEDDPNLVVPISGDALRGEGYSKTPSPDAEGRIRLRDPGLGIGQPGDPAFTLSATSPGGVGVRRLTPTECERLQALPDGWTQPGPDPRRYAALGDAVTASVGEWIGRRLLDEEGGSRLGPANPSSSSGSGVADLA